MNRRGFIDQGSLLALAKNFQRYLLTLRLHALDFVE